MEFKHCHDFIRLYMKLASNLQALYLVKECKKKKDWQYFIISP